MLPALCGNDPQAAAEAAAAAAAPPAAELLAAAAKAAKAQPSKAVKYDDLVENEADVHGVSANIHTTRWKKGRVSKAQLGEEELVAQVGGQGWAAGWAGMGWDGPGRAGQCIAAAAAAAAAAGLSRLQRRPARCRAPPAPPLLPPPSRQRASPCAPSPPQVLSEAASGRRGRLYITDGCVPGCVPGCDSSDPGLTCLVNNAGDALVPRPMRTTRAESLSHSMMVRGGGAGWGA
jgi:pyruvate/2-oxoglutarate dehydrogenase complex dihydrolipoamide acyltransferase (E2) component